MIPYKRWEFHGRRHGCELSLSRVSGKSPYAVLDDRLAGHDLDHRDAPDHAVAEAAERGRRVGHRNRVRDRVGGRDDVEGHPAAQAGASGLGHQAGAVEDPPAVVDAAADDDDPASPEEGLQHRAPRGADRRHHARGACGRLLLRDEEDVDVRGERSAQSTEVVEPREVGHPERRQGRGDRRLGVRDLGGGVGELIEGQDLDRPRLGGEQDGVSDDEIGGRVARQVVVPDQDHVALGAAGASHADAGEAVAGRGAHLTARARQAGRPATVDVGLARAHHPVRAARGQAATEHAGAGRAVAVDAAGEPVGAAAADRATAVDVGLVLVCATVHAGAVEVDLAVGAVAAVDPGRRARAARDVEGAHRDVRRDPRHDHERPARATAARAGTAAGAAVAAAQVHGAGDDDRVERVEPDRASAAASAAAAVIAGAVARGRIVLTGPAAAARAAPQRHQAVVGRPTRASGRRGGDLLTVLARAHVARAAAPGLLTGAAEAGPRTGSVLPGEALHRIGHAAERHPVAPVSAREPARAGRAPDAPRPVAGEGAGGVAAGAVEGAGDPDVGRRLDDERNAADHAERGARRHLERADLQDAVHRVPAPDHHAVEQSGVGVEDLGARDDDRRRGDARVRAAVGVDHVAVVAAFAGCHIEHAVAAGVRGAVDVAGRGLPAGAHAVAVAHLAGRRVDDPVAARRHGAVGVARRGLPAGAHSVAVAGLAGGGVGDDIRYCALGSESGVRCVPRGSARPPRFPGRTG